MELMGFEPISKYKKFKYMYIFFHKINIYKYIMDFIYKYILNNVLK